MATYLAESRVRSSGGKGKKTNYLSVYCYDRTDPTVLAKKYLSDRGQFHDPAKPVFDGEPLADLDYGLQEPFLFVYIQQEDFSEIISREFSRMQKKA